MLVQRLDFASEVSREGDAGNGYVAGVDPFWGLRAREIEVERWESRTGADTMKGWDHGLATSRHGHGEEELKT